MFVAIPTLSCDPSIHGLFQFHHTPPHQFLWYQSARSLPRCIFISWIPWVAADPNFNHAGHQTSILKGKSCSHPSNQTENPPCLSFLLPFPITPIHCSSKRNVFKEVTCSTSKDPQIWSCLHSSPLKLNSASLWKLLYKHPPHSTLPMPFKTNTSEGQAELVCSLITTITGLIKMGCWAHKRLFPTKMRRLSTHLWQITVSSKHNFPHKWLDTHKSEKNAWTL